ncbi:MAG: TonB-dependent receptor plug domain-containing protein, partial [Bacteroidota bacterium]
MTQGRTKQRPGYRVLRHVVLLLLTLVFRFLPAIAQPVTAPPDTARGTTIGQIDSLARGAIPPRIDSAGRIDTIIADSTVRLDSLRTRLPVRELGAPLGSVTELFAVPGTDFITKRDRIWERYTTPHDFIARVLPAYPLSQGVPGLLRTLSYGTSGPGAISYLYDGRPLLGLFGAAYESEFYPAEFLERVEVVRGARAAIVGSGESLIALNFVQPRYDVEGSYTRLWYAQAPGSSTAGDITYDRNVGRKGNLALGWRDGVTRIELGGYIHRISAPDGSGLPSTTVAGADARIIIPYGVFRLDNHLIGTFGDRTTTPHPVLYGESELYAQLRLLGGNLDLRLGTSLEYQSSASRVRYDVISNRFYMNTADAAIPGLPFPLWGAYLQARIGSAYLRLEMRNILDVSFDTIDRYPTFGRGV